MCGSLGRIIIERDEKHLFDENMKRVATHCARLTYKPANIVMFRRIFQYVGARTDSFRKSGFDSNSSDYCLQVCTPSEGRQYCIMGRHMCSGGKAPSLEPKQIVDVSIGVTLDIDHRSANIYSRSFL